MTARAEPPAPSDPTATRLSIRTRLTLVYGGLFFATSGTLLGVWYLLTRQAVDQRFPSARIITGRVSRLPSDAEAVGAPPDSRGFEMVQKALEEQLEAQKQEMLSGLLQTSVLLLLGFGLLAIVIGYVVAGRMLRPLNTMTVTAQRLSESTLHERIALDGPQDELKNLADTFDRMLDRLHRAFETQRRFTANASHELRTPLTINRTVLEVALASPRNPPETKTLAEVLLGNTARHERLIEGLLLLSRSERELETIVPVALSEVADTALDQVEYTDDVDVRTDLRDAATPGDPVLLERCAVNLLDNAVKYNVEGGVVEVETGVADGASFLRVSNTGRVIAPYEIETIFEPFRRLRGDRIGSSRGAGLGMSIVAAIVQAHGGELLAVPRGGGGLTVTVRLAPVPAQQLAAVRPTETVAAPSAPPSAPPQSADPLDPAEPRELPEPSER